MTWTSTHSTPSSTDTPMTASACSPRSRAMSTAGPCSTPAATSTSHPRSSSTTSPTWTWTAGPSASSPRQRRSSDSSTGSGPRSVARRSDQPACASIARTTPHPLPLADASVRLLVSLYAGFVSEHCSRYLATRRLAARQRQPRRCLDGRARPRVLARRGGDHPGRRLPRGQRRPRPLHGPAGAGWSRPRTSCIGPTAASRSPSEPSPTSFDEVDAGRIGTRPAPLGTLPCSGRLRGTAHRSWPPGSCRATGEPDPRQRWGAPCVRCD